MEFRRGIAAEFSARQKVSFLAVLMRVARADDVSIAERNRLIPVLEWIDVDEELQADAIREADNPDLSLATLVQPLVDPLSRWLLFRECCAVVWVDITKSAREKALLEELGEVLRLHPEVIEVLDSPLACSPEGERRFLELLGGTSAS